MRNFKNNFIEWLNPDFVDNYYWLMERGQNCV